MDKSEPKHRKKLNVEQLEVLELLYKFRFGSNDLIAQYFGKKDRSFVFKRLSILLERGLIGKRFDSSYRLLGKPAAYYLTPAGARALQERWDANKDVINIKAIYKDKSVSGQFVQHSLDVFAIYNHLKARYGTALKFFSKATLNYERFDYFPKPLPDVYLRLKFDDGEKHFFLDIYHEEQPLFAMLRRIKGYADYADEGEWEETGTDMPTVLIVCDSLRLQIKLQKRIAASGRADDAKFLLSNKAELLESQSSDAAWTAASDPDQKISLESFHGTS